MVLAEADALAAQEGRAQEAGALFKKVGFGLGFVGLCGLGGGGYVTTYTLLSKGGWMDGWLTAFPTKTKTEIQHQRTIKKNRCTRI